MLKEWNLNAFQNSQWTIHKIHWTPEVTLEGTAYLIKQRNGSKVPNLDADDE
jgi:hypothetical protein